MADVFYERGVSITTRLSRFKNSVRKYIVNTYGDENIEERLLKSHIRNIIFPKTLKDEIAF